MSKQYYNLRDADVREILEDYQLGDFSDDDNVDSTAEVKLNYWMIKMIEDNSNNNVHFVQYWRTLKYYIFLFKYRDQVYFFTRLTIEQVEKLNISTGNNSYIL